MLLLDANVLIRAFRADIEGQPKVAAWLRDLLSGGARFGVPDGILMSFVRIVTQRPFDPVTPIELALTFADRVRSSPACTVMHASVPQWQTFVRVCRLTRAHGRRAQDVYWASFALADGDVWVTFDRGFGTIPGLRWRTPFDLQVRTNPR